MFGGAVYGAIETIWRGYTHPTMIVLGGACMTVISAVRRKFRPHPIASAAIGSLIITTGELVTGCICNLWLGLDVWDYSDVRYNLLGQICLRYSLYWALLSVPAFTLAGVIDDGFSTWQVRIKVSRVLSARKTAAYREI